MMVVAAVGCAQKETAGGTPTEPAANLDCAYPLLWNEVRYVPGIDLPASSRLGPDIDSGVVLGCASEEMGYYPDEDVRVRRIESVDPFIAVAALIKDAARPIVWRGHGYLVESPRHPLHSAIAWGLDGHQGFTCGESQTTTARALLTPAPGQPLEVGADDTEVEALLAASGTQRLVSIDEGTAISGLERHGVPYVERGDEFVLAVRPCDGDETSRAWPASACSSRTASRAGPERRSPLLHHSATVGRPPQHLAAGRIEVTCRRC
jgi:hypothetical protein